MDTAQLHNIDLYWRNPHPLTRPVATFPKVRSSKRRDGRDRGNNPRHGLYAAWLARRRHSSFRAAGVRQSMHLPDVPETSGSPTFVRIPTKQSPTRVRPQPESRQSQTGLK
jgi:hypothetical protein